ncbi:MAG: homocysteine S-methyltransferase family protein [Pseudomonadota bacterium]
MTTFDPARPGAFERPVLLDGGMGQELIARAGRETSNWSAEFLTSHPELVRRIHRDFFEAGADVATVNSYGVNRRRHPTAAERDALNDAAGRAALDAREAHGRGLIAGSLPPYGGSYVPSAVADVAELAPLYEEQARALAPYVDFYLCETMSTPAEGRAAALGAAALGKPVWEAWTLADDGSGLLRDGSTLDAAVDAVADLGVAAFLVNCSAPEALAPAIPELARRGVPGAYANGFRRIPDGWALSGATSAALGRREELSPAAYLEEARGWIDGGARIVGGCCHIGPAHIAALAAEIGAGAADFGRVA